MSTMDETRAALQRDLTHAAGEPVTVIAARPLAGGASMETWALDVEVAGARLDLVLRRDMGSNMYAGALTRADEFAVIRAMHAHGVKAPRPRWLFAHADETSRAFFVMDRLAGESVGRRVVRAPELADARTLLAAQLGAELAKIHAVPLAAVPIAWPAREGSVAQQALDDIAAVIRTQRRPILVFALRWMRRHAPEPSGAPVVLHGDYRIGNLLITPSGLSGVIDWEFARIGDALEDLAWPLVRDWRFEHDALHVGGVGTLDDYLGAYEQACGRRVDREALAWWETLGNLRWAAICHAQATRHLSGIDRSVELASLGRKASEIEWELLDRIRRAEGDIAR